MRRNRDDKREVQRALVMVMQFGINMLVPVCMMSAIGIWLDNKLGTSFLTIILFVIGALAGGQNIYRMAKSVCAEDASDKELRPIGETDRKPEKKK